MEYSFKGQFPFGLRLADFHSELGAVKSATQSISGEKANFNLKTFPCNVLACRIYKTQNLPFRVFSHIR